MLQILRALAGNALVHTPAGTEVRITTAVDGDRSLVTVSDDGPGVPREHVERIFDRFYRVEGRQASGSGLGLAIARELAEHMDGTVDHRVERGRTAFTLALPHVPSPALAVST